MKLLNRVLATARLWTLVIPNAPHPPPDMIARWCDDFSDEVLESAIVRTSRKFRGQVLADPEAAWRYCTGVCVHINRRAIQATEKYPLTAA
jgi:hypothetical protein